MRLRSVYRVLSSYLRFKMGKPRLSYIVYCCTARCNLRCVFCNWWRCNIEELKTGDALKVVGQLADFGVVAIDFSGGEPTLREDLEILAGDARERGVYTVLSTNGTTITGSRAKSLSRVFDVVNISLDGFEYTHDSTRGVTGTYRRVLKTIQHLRENNVKVGIDLTIYSANVDEAVQLFKNLIGAVDFVSFQPVMPYPPPVELKPESEKVNMLIKSLLELKEDMPQFIAPTRWYIEAVERYFQCGMSKICDAGTLYAMIDPDGTLLACNAVRGSVIGKITETPLKDLWVSGKRAHALKAVDSCRGCLSQCTTLISMSYRKPSLETIKSLVNYA
ncbi:radical SAM protein [Candidatus Bathyarchaeota archaeon]|nr:radical SAM protein [Candidatus Bathyarchaeota archaeon]